MNTSLQQVLESQLQSRHHLDNSHSRYIGIILQWNSNLLSKYLMYHVTQQQLSQLSCFSLESRQNIYFCRLLNILALMKVLLDHPLCPPPTVLEFQNKEFKYNFLNRNKTFQGGQQEFSYYHHHHHYYYYYVYSQFIIF